MTIDPLAIQPVRSPLCPLCGQPNACQPAQTGSFAQPCWCQKATFTAELLASVSENARNKACICQACANRSNNLN